MNAIPKKKLCWNCEGNVSQVEEACPYCGVSVRSSSLEDTGGNIISPYRLTTSQKEHMIPLAPYASYTSAESHKEEEETTPPEEEEAILASGDFKKVFLPALFLLTGSVFFLFGLILMLFSHNDILTLHWKTGFWFVYLLSSIPLLFFGWRALQKMEDE